MNLHSPPDAIWPAPPLIGGTWRALAPEQAMRVMIRLCAADSNARAICDSHDVLAVRMRPLIAIRDGLLIEFLARPHATGTERIGVFIYRPGLFDLLDGGSAVLHRICEEGGLVVEDAAQALEYVELFCAAVAGDDGSFYPAPPDFPVVRNPADPALAQSLEVLIRPASTAGNRSMAVALSSPVLSQASIQAFRSSPTTRPCAIRNWLAQMSIALAACQPSRLSGAFMA